MPNRSIAALRKAALALPEAEEGTSCNKACFKAGKKNFLFIGESADSWNIMLKVGDSAAELERLAKKEPDKYGVGGSGWLTATFGKGEAAPKGLLEPLVEESYRLIVPKKLSAQLDGE